MPKQKLQAYLEGDTFEKLERLAKRFGWTSGQVVDRLVGYYARTQAAVLGFDTDQYDERWGGDEGESGSCVIFTDPEGFDASECVSTCEGLCELVEAVKEGLIPFDGFGDEEV